MCQLRIRGIKKVVRKAKNQKNKKKLWWIEWTMQIKWRNSRQNISNVEASNSEAKQIQHSNHSPSDWMQISFSLRLCVSFIYFFCKRRNFQRVSQQFFVWNSYFRNGMKFILQTCHWGFLQLDLHWLDPWIVNIC